MYRLCQFDYMNAPHGCWLSVCEPNRKDLFILALFGHRIQPGRLDGNCTRMLQSKLNISWKQHPTKQQMFGHRPPISKTIQIMRTRHAGLCWRSKDELINDVLWWTHSRRCASVGQQTRTYLQQLCTDTGRRLEDLPESMDDRDECWERESQGNP